MKAKAEFEITCRHSQVLWRENLVVVSMVLVLEPQVAVQAVTIYRTNERPQGIVLHLN